MHIVHVASELAPIAKVGGLGDVLLGLPQELVSQGHTVSVIIPKYDCMNLEPLKELSEIVAHQPIVYGEKEHTFSVWSGKQNKVTVYLVEPHHPRNFFQRGCFYGCEDDLERYLWFCKAVLEFLSLGKVPVDVLHLHDWQGAGVAPLYRDLYRERVGDIRLTYTIHNIEYQGKCTTWHLSQLGLNGSGYLNLERMADNYDPNSINLMKGGIVYSDNVTTVSPTYSREVQTPEGGRGLESTLRQHKAKFTGILNGIDATYWNPATDPYLPHHYDTTERPEPVHTSKQSNKDILRRRVGIEPSDKPLVACVTRLVPQKGIDLLEHALFHTLERGGQFILLGTSPIPEIQQHFEGLRDRFADSPDVSIVLEHSEEIAHLMYSGSDIFIVPSLFEPCGLTQMIAMKYGTVPIVRETGGLADSVFDIDYSDKQFEQTNGYSFRDANATGVNSALDRAISCWYNEKGTWRELVGNCMRADYSWKVSASDYVNIYTKATT